MYWMEVAVMSHSAGGRNTRGLKLRGRRKGSSEVSDPADARFLLLFHLTRKKAAMHMVSPRNMPQACRNGWSKPRRFPSVDSDVIVSAHLRKRQKKERLKTMLRDNCNLIIRITSSCICNITLIMAMSYLTDNVLMDPVMSMSRARPKWKRFILALT